MALEHLPRQSEGSGPAQFRTRERAVAACLAESIMASSGRWCGQQQSETSEAANGRGRVERAGRYSAHVIELRRMAAEADDPRKRMPAFVLLMQLNSRPQTGSVGNDG